MTSPTVERYRISKIAKVLRMNPKVINNWIHSPKGVFALSDEDERAIGAGGNYKLSFESALRIAMLRVMSNHGLPPDRGMTVVMEYMETGGEHFVDEKSYRREPATDFEGGDDVHTLVLLGRDVGADEYEIRPAGLNDKWLEVLGAAPFGVSVINLTLLRKQLAASLAADTEGDTEI